MLPCTDPTIPPLTAVQLLMFFLAVIGTCGFVVIDTELQQGRSPFGGAATIVN